MFKIGGGKIRKIDLIWLIYYAVACMSSFT